MEIQKNNNLEEVRQSFLDNLSPMRQVSMSELIPVCENIFRYKDQELPATHLFSSEFDKLIGITPEQRMAVFHMSGEIGLSKFRNYLNTANNYEKSLSVVLVSNQNRNAMHRIVPIAGEFITPQEFMAFAELLADATGYELDDVAADATNGEITLFYNHPHPNVLSVTQEDEFITDGFALTWNISRVSLSHYFIRLVCTNGMIGREAFGQETMANLDEDTLHKTIKMLSSKTFAMEENERLQFYVQRAIENRISMREMDQMKKLLFDCGVDEDTCEALIPVHSSLETYREHGHSLGVFEMAKAKGPGSIWEYYNVLTDFASHSEILGPNDARRGIIMKKAYGFLTKKPDMSSVQLIDVF